MELSKRLSAVAGLVSSGLVVADIGTDHGYIPIFLLESGKCEKAFAMDVNEGPLKRARDHIAIHGLSRKIELRLSDGVKALEPGECECVVIAGMGGGLAIKILEEGNDVFQSLKEFVLQPQSELSKVREYLWRKGYKVVEEDMVEEDGKFYPMMKVTKGSDSEYSNIELRYGRNLLKDNHPVLKIFLDKELRSKENILKNLEKQSGEHIEIRKKELQEELSMVKKALEMFK